MKILIGLILSISIVPISIAGMIYGWGIQPENWGWVCFSYLWMYVVSLISPALSEE